MSKLRFNVQSVICLKRQLRAIKRGKYEFISIFDSDGLKC